MKNFRLTLIRWDSFLFRILFRDKKKLNSTTPDMLYGVKQKRKTSMLFSDVLKMLCYFCDIFMLFFD